MNGLKCFSEHYLEKLQKLFLCIQWGIQNQWLISFKSPDFVNPWKALYIEFPEEQYAAVEKLKDGCFVNWIHFMTRTVWFIHVTQTFETSFDLKKPLKSQFFPKWGNIWLICFLTMVSIVSSLAMFILKILISKNIKESGKVQTGSQPEVPWYPSGIHPILQPEVHLKYWKLNSWKTICNDCNQPSKYLAFKRN